MLRYAGLSSKRLIVGCLIAASSACALVADLGDRTLAEGTDGGRTNPDGAPTDGTTPKPPDGSTNPDGGPGTPPAFCAGIVFYASLDSFDADKSGGTYPIVQGGVKAEANGKFGPSVVLRNDALDAGASLYYARPDSGAFVFPKTQGSVSLWYKPDQLNPPTGTSPVVYRWVGSLPPAPLEATDLLLVALSNRFGIVNSTGGTTDMLTFTYPAIRPYLKRDAFNHYVTAWRTPGAGPTAYMALNGGTGERFDDAGGAADPYTDAAVNDAGDLLVPYRGYTSKSWTPSAIQAAAFRLGGTGTSAAEGNIDDIAIWDRVLSFDEMAAIYKAGAAIGAVCKLK
jgi:hypothetical protein